MDKVISMTGNINTKNLLIGGAAIFGVWYFFGERLGLGAEDKKASVRSIFQGIINRITGLPTPSDEEQAQVEMSGFTVDTVPAAYALSAENVPTITSQSPYNYEVMATEVSNVGVGQESVSHIGSQIRTLDIQGFDPCCLPTTMSLPDVGMPTITGIAGAGRGADLTTVQGKTNHDVLDPSVNSDYTDGMRTMSLAQWRSEGIVDRVSETSVRYFPGDGGADCMLRRV